MSRVTRWILLVQRALQGTIDTVQDESVYVAGVDDSFAASVPQ